MNTLFIDTHSETLFMAYIENKTILKIKKEGNRSHSEIAIPSLMVLLNESGKKLEDIEEIIVVNGPGSFTGVRIGITIAKTIAYSLHIPIKTITSLEAVGCSLKEDTDLVTVSDTKGFYSAKKNGSSYTDFQYMKKNEFEKYINDNNLTAKTTNEYDLYSILDYLKNKEYTNPHSVNPIYIKEIDALK